jgi:hypothetical protein
MCLSRNDATRLVIFPKEIAVKFGARSAPAAESKAFFATQSTPTLSHILAELFMYSGDMPDWIVNL